MLHFCNHIPNPDFAIIYQTLICNHIPNPDFAIIYQTLIRNHIPNPDFAIDQTPKFDNVVFNCGDDSSSKENRKIRPKSISVLIVLTESLRPYSIISWTELSDFRLATMTLSRISRGWTFLLWSYGSFKNLIPADLSILW